MALRVFLAILSAPSFTVTQRKTEIVLRAATETDLEFFFDHQREPAANDMAAFPARDRETFMAHWNKILADKSVVKFTIVVGDSIAGNVVSWRNNNKQLIGYWIGQAFWGKGVASEALREFTQRLTVRPLHAFVAKKNVASIRVLEKCGFTNFDVAANDHERPKDGVEELVYVLLA